MRVKEYRLKPGSKLTFQGQRVLAGDTVHLTESQAVAFRDQIEPTDDGDFEDMDEVPEYKPAEQAKERGTAQGATEDAPQGQPVSQPPVPVRGDAGPEGPVDPHTMDPAKQGQQSREQRDIIDAGGAPPPAIFTGDAGTKVSSKIPAGASTAHIGTGTHVGSPTGATGKPASTKIPDAPTATK